MGALVTRLVNKFRDEPVLVTQVAAAVLALLVALGFALPASATAAVMGVAQLIAALIGRSQVTPVRSLPDPALGVAS